MKSRIMYGLILLLSIFIFVWTGTKEAFFLFAVLCVLIPIVVLLNAVVARKISVSAGFVPGTTKMQIEYNNQALFFAFHVQTKIHLINTFTDTELQFLHDKTMLPRSRKMVEIPIESQFAGRIEISISQCVSVDLLGLSKFAVKAKSHGNTYVYPELVYDQEEEIIKQARENTSPDAFYQNRKGNDITEILNIREYQKGDSMKSIHWKLSLKQKQKLVREFDMPVNQEVLILFALSEKKKNQPEARHELAKSLLGVAELLYNEQIFYDGTLISNRGVSHKYTVDSEEAYEWYILRVLDGELSFSLSELEAYMARHQVEKKYSTIIMITDKDVISEDYEQMGVTHIVADC